MIRIGIVDDEEPVRNMICQCIEQSLENYDETEFITFSKGEAFIKELQNGIKFDRQNCR